MTPTIQAIAVPVLLNLAYVQPMTLDNRTAVSLVLEALPQVIIDVCLKGKPVRRMHVI